jgi:flagellar biosynthesis chaperone FliJ
MAEMLAVRRFKEGLEKLRAQAEQEYIHEAERIEQKESDERSAIAFARRDDGE